jgi:hypothetical protein
MDFQEQLLFPFPPPGLLEFNEIAGLNCLRTFHRNRPVLRWQGDNFKRAACVTLITKHGLCSHTIEPRWSKVLWLLYPSTIAVMQKAWYDLRNDLEKIVKFAAVMQYNCRPTIEAP